MDRLLLDQREIPQGRIVLLCLAILAAVVVGMYIVQRVKKQMQQTDAGPGAGFTLSDLRALHKSGKMTTEEFELAKAKVVEAVRRAEARKAEGATPAKSPLLDPHLFDPPSTEK